MHACTRARASNTASTPSTGFERRAKASENDWALIYGELVNGYRKHLEVRAAWSPSGCLGSATSGQRGAVAWESARRPPPICPRPRCPRPRCRGSAATIRLDHNNAGESRHRRRRRSHVDRPDGVGRAGGVGAAVARAVGKEPRAAARGDHLLSALPPPRRAAAPERRRGAVGALCRHVRTRTVRSRWPVLARAPHRAIVGQSDCASEGSRPPPTSPHLRRA